MQRMVKGTLRGRVSCLTHWGVQGAGCVRKLSRRRRGPRRIAGSVWNQARAARRDQAKYDPTNLFRMNQNIAPAPLADAPGDDRSTGRAGRSLRSTAQVWRHRSFAVRETVRHYGTIQRGSA
ncbi:BBE domain-containing protein [Paraburkholderia hospita]|uniref:BBE domain-containing protein n=1 Tax=Paraburkholderia hospita TaxID=169430 RepID=UPI003100C9EA